MNEIAPQQRISDILDEYNEKKDALESALGSFNAAGEAVDMASTVRGTYGRTHIDTGHIHLRTLQQKLLKSAWWCIYEGLNIGTIAPATDRRRFEQSMESPIEFTIDNIRATFGDYIQSPHDHILRGLAEVFSSLDPAFKSHEKVKIGVKGLPKRVIISNVATGYGWGVDKLKDILNAIAVYQRKPLVSHHEIQKLLKDENALIHPSPEGEEFPRHEHLYHRGVRLRLFSNGNGHLFFEPDTLLDVNRALAEYYGEVLPDCAEERPAKHRASTSVSKDLQYYPTPTSVAERIVEGLNVRDKWVLEPSCGCGRIMDALRDAGANVVGIEYDKDRVEECRAKGHGVFRGNFLETAPTGSHDLVVMNPPFYGKHYVKHIEHALKFLKTGGELVAILPVTARYDHKLVDGHWNDLPVGSFAESGTRVNTTVLTIRKKAND